MNADDSLPGDDRFPVLVAAHTNTFFTEMYRVAQLLKHSPRYRPLVLFGWSYPTIALDITRCLREGLPCLDEGGQPIIQIAGPQPPRRRSFGWARGSRHWISCPPGSQLARSFSFRQFFPLLALSHDTPAIRGSGTAANGLQAACDGWRHGRL